MKDFYKILEIDRSSNVIKIKKAYRTLALKLHPDVNTSSSAHLQFIEINEAYQILHNPLKRKEYDRIYSVLILNKKPLKPAYYQKKAKKWTNYVNNQATKGRENAKKYENQSDKKFKCKFNFFNYWFFDILIQGVFEIIIGIF